MELEERVKRLEQIAGIACKTIPLSCPFCGEKAEGIEVKQAGAWFVATCRGCGGAGPGVSNPQDAIMTWNKFVSHHGKVPHE